MTHQPWRPPSHRIVRCSLALLLNLPAVLWAAAATADARRFNIPAGAAEQTLKQFSAQSEVQLSYPTDSVQGIRTNAVQGEYHAIDALERMVAGTPLIVVRDEKPGAFAIKRVDDPNVQRAAQTTASDRPRNQISQTLPMKLQA